MNKKNEDYFIEKMIDLAVDMPPILIYFCTNQLGAFVTTKIDPSITTAELTLIDALKLYGEYHKI